MEAEEWLVGWRAIGKYIGRSGRTAQRWARDGMPFFRDPAGRPVTKRSLIDEYILDLNQEYYDDKKWKGDGIGTALSYENYREKQKKDFNERFLLAQRPTKSLY